MNTTIFKRAMALLFVSLLMSSPLWADTPPPRFGHTIVNLDGRILIFGGQGAEEGREAPLLNDLWEFNSSTNEFTEIQAANAPAPRVRHSAAAVDGKMYVFFGLDANNGVLSDVQVYDPQSNSWSQAPDPPLAPASRTDHTATATDDGKILLFGGRSGSGPFPDLWEYDPASNTWNQKNTMPATPRFGHNTAFLNGKLHVFGGRTADDSFVDETWEYSPDNDQWTQLETSATPPGRAYQAAADDGSSMWVLGGNDAQAQLSDIWEFKASDQSWTQDENSLEQPLTNSAAIVLPSVEFLSREVKILLFGGVTTDDKIINDSPVVTPGGEDPPPPTPEDEIAIQLGGLRFWQFAVVKLQFAETQKEVKVQVDWPNEETKLVLHGCAKNRSFSFSALEEAMERQGKRGRSWKKLTRLLPDERQHGVVSVPSAHCGKGKFSTTLEKTFSDVRRLTLVLRHARGKSVRDVKILISAMDANPQEILYRFPVGRVDSSDEPKINQVKLTEVPVRFHSKIFPRKGEETTEENEGNFTWQYADPSQCIFGFGKVKFELP